MQTSSQANDHRLRIMFFDHVASLSGAEVALLNLIRHFDLDVICPVVALGEDGPLAERLRSSVEVHILPMRADVQRVRKDELGARSLLSLAALRETVRYIFRLRQFIRTHKIDVVQANSLKSDILGALAARLTRTPVIWYVRDRITPDYLPARVAQVFRWLSQWLPNLIIADSHAVARTLSAVPCTRVRVVHEGTPHEEFAQHGSCTATQSQEGHPVVGLVGRISFWKGQDIFIRAAALLKSKYPSAEFRIIGSALFDEAEFELGLHTLVEQLGLERTVVFSGFRHDIHQAMSELDILVHASTKPEPFGQVIIEGMAAGKPVVATNAGGVPEIVDDGITGFLVPMGEVDAMAGAIDRLLQDPEMARLMGSRGQVHVAENFTIQRTVDGVMDCYRYLTQRALIGASHRSEPVPRVS